MLTPASELKWAVILCYSEIYSLSSGDEIPKPITRPDCECPRSSPALFYKLETGSDFPFYDAVRSFYSAYECSDMIAGNISYSRVSPSAAPQSIFMDSGWQSDLTKNADISLRFPQTMLVSLST